MEVAGPCLDGVFYLRRITVFFSRVRDVRAPSHDRQMRHSCEIFLPSAQSSCTSIDCSHCRGFGGSYLQRLQARDVHTLGSNRVFRFSASVYSFLVFEGKNNPIYLFSSLVGRHRYITKTMRGEKNRNRFFFFSRRKVPKYH